jgi:small subunit ribosomal protein S4
MGDPRKLRKSWEKPRKMFDKSRIIRERIYVNKYGFKRKKEIWKIEYLFKNYKRRARNILANYDENEKNILVSKLARLGILSKNSSLDDVLNLELENFCNRRLQTIVHKKGLANTVKQARQLITHKKIIVGDKIIDQPNYLVLKEEEDKINVKVKKKKPKEEKKSEKIEESTERVKEGEEQSQEVKEEEKVEDKPVKEVKTEEKPKEETTQEKSSVDEEKK